MLYHTGWVLQAGTGPGITDVLSVLPIGNKMIEQKILKTIDSQIPWKLTQPYLFLTTVMVMTPLILNFM